MMTATRDPYALFATIYDLEIGPYDADLPMLTQFTQAAGGPVLELGCGSGRVLHHLLDVGVPLTGIDTSPSMLQIARSVLPPEVTLLEGSIEDLDACVALRDDYWFAFAAINTFLHLPDSDAQIRALTGLRERVVSGGLLLLDLLVPDPHWLLSHDGRMQHEFGVTKPDGTRLDKWVTRSHDLASQSIWTEVWIDVTPPTGPTRRAHDRYLTRYLHRWELEHLLVRTGWDLISLYGSYDLDPFESDSERMIALATNPQANSHTHTHAHNERSTD